MPVAAIVALSTASPAKNSKKVTSAEGGLSTQGPIGQERTEEDGGVAVGANEDPGASSHPAALQALGLPPPVLRRLFLDLMLPFGLPLPVPPPPLPRPASPLCPPFPLESLRGQSMARCEPEHKLQIWRLPPVQISRQPPLFQAAQICPRAAPEDAEAEEVLAMGRALPPLLAPRPLPPKPRDPSTVVPAEPSNSLDAANGAEIV